MPKGSNPNSIANFTGPHKRGPQLPYKPKKLKLYLEPQLLDQIEQYQTDRQIKTRSQAIAQLITIGLTNAKRSGPHPLMRAACLPIQAMLDPILIPKIKAFVVDNGFHLRLGQSQAIAFLINDALEIDL
jgi:hypothetical protein